MATIPDLTGDEVKEVKKYVDGMNNELSASLKVLKPSTFPVLHTDDWTGYFVQISYLYRRELWYVAKRIRYELIQWHFEQISVLAYWEVSRSEQRSTTID